MGGAKIKTGFSTPCSVRTDRIASVPVFPVAGPAALPPGAFPDFAGMPLLLHSPSPTRPRAALHQSTLALLGVALLAAFASFAPDSRADSIPVRSAELRVDEGEVLLNADFDFTLNSTLEEALQRGVPLHFVLEFELALKRWYWFDETVAQEAYSYRVSYTALTRQYRVASGLLAQNFASLEEVERYIGRVTSRRVGSVAALSPGTRYDAAVRLRLDVNQLPKPFQVNALASRDWTLSSEWHRWSFIP